MARKVPVRRSRIGHRAHIRHIPNEGAGGYCAACGEWFPNEAAQRIHDTRVHGGSRTTYVPALIWRPSESERERFVTEEQERQHRAEDDFFDPSRQRRQNYNISAWQRGRERELRAAGDPDRVLFPLGIDTPRQRREYRILRTRGLTEVAAVNYILESGSD